MQQYDLEWEDMKTRIDMLLFEKEEKVSLKFKNVEKLYNYHENVVQKFMLILE